MIDPNANKPKLNEPSLMKDNTSVSDSKAIDSLLDDVLADEPSSSPTPSTSDKPSTADVPQPGDADTDVADETPQPEVVPPVKPEVPPVVKTEIKPEDKPADKPLTDEEIEKIAKPKGMSPSKSKDWDKLQTVAVERGRKLKEIEPKLTQLEAQVRDLNAKVANPELPAEIKQRIAELEEFHNAHNMLGDPEFVNKYFKPMAELENSVMEFLERNQMPKEAMDVIKKQGILGTPSEGWKTILDTLQDSDPVARERLGKMLADFYNLNDSQQKALADAPKRVQEWKQKREGEMKVRKETFEKNINTEIDGLRKMFPQAIKREANANATPEQRAEIEAHNSQVDRIEKDFVSTFQAIQRGDPKALTQTVAGALLAVAQSKEIDRLDGVVKQRDERVAQLEGEVSRMKGVGKLPAGDTPKTPPTAHQNFTGLLKMKDADAVEAGLKAIGA